MPADIINLAQHLLTNLTYKWRLTYIIRSYTVNIDKLLLIFGSYSEISTYDNHILKKILNMGRAAKEFPTHLKKKNEDAKTEMESDFRQRPQNAFRCIT